MIDQGKTWAAPTPIPARPHKNKIKVSGEDGFKLISTTWTTAQKAMPMAYAMRLFNFRDVHSQKGQGKDGDDENHTHDQVTVCFASHDKFYKIKQDGLKDIKTKPR